MERHPPQTVSQVIVAFVLWLALVGAVGIYAYENYDVLVIAWMHGLLVAAVLFGLVFGAPIFWIGFYLVYFVVVACIRLDEFFSRIARRCRPGKRSLGGGGKSVFDW